MRVDDERTARRLVEGQVPAAKPGSSPCFVQNSCTSPMIRRPRYRRSNARPHGSRRCFQAQRSARVRRPRPHYQSVDDLPSTRKAAPRIDERPDDLPSRPSRSPSVPPDPLLRQRGAAARSAALGFVVLSRAHQRITPGPPSVRPLETFNTSGNECSARTDRLEIEDRDLARSIDSDAALPAMRAAAARAMPPW
jgi:hypothetical protein